MKIAVAQINTVICDFDSNTAKIISYIKEAETIGADLVVFPEMAVCGHFPDNLLLYEENINRNIACLEKIAEAAKKTAVITGFIDRNNEGNPVNSAAFIHYGKILSVHNEEKISDPQKKNYLCNGESSKTVSFMDTEISIQPGDIREDTNADLIINLCSTYYRHGIILQKEKEISRAAKNSSAQILRVNRTGAEGQHIFFGRSTLFNENGVIRKAAPAFKEGITLFRGDEEARETESLPDMEMTKLALVTGIKDYAQKSGFTKALIGLSGGIDSALTAALAVEALGPENVSGITMPSPYSTSGSINDSYKLAENLGIKIDTIEIKELFAQFKKELSPVFGNLPEDLTEENIQARIRGTLLMAVSNKTGALLLATGNKSEIAVGYATLYGDMCGSLSVIGDLLKTQVYELSRYMNRDQEIIPEEIIIKEPSAELRPDQKDSDSLPEYDTLDKIAELFLNMKKSKQQIIDSGFKEEDVENVVRRILMSEYKRRQGAPILKLTDHTFGLEETLPLVHRFRG